MVEDDRTLLELAARAAGIKPRIWNEPVFAYEGGQKLKNGGIWNYQSDSPLWNPLEDDADAFRLAVQLKFHTMTGEACAISGASEDDTDVLIKFSAVHGDEYAATRRAIVIAAAEIGKAMQEG